MKKKWDVSHYSSGVEFHISHGAIADHLSGHDAPKIITMFAAILAFCPKPPIADTNLENTHKSSFIEYTPICCPLKLRPISENTWHVDYSWQGDTYCMRGVHLINFSANDALMTYKSQFFLSYE